MSEDRKGPSGDEGGEEVGEEVVVAFLPLPPATALLRLRLLLFLREGEGDAFLVGASVSIVFPRAAESLTAALFFFVVLEGGGPRR